MSLNLHFSQYKSLL